MSIFQNNNAFSLIHDKKIVGSWDPYQSNNSQINLSLNQLNLSVKENWQLFMFSKTNKII